jgi:S1-C subfamily serine protease
MFKRTVKEKIVISVMVSLFIFAIFGIIYCSSLSNQEIHKQFNSIIIEQQVQQKNLDNLREEGRLANDNLSVKIDRLATTSKNIDLMIAKDIDLIISKEATSLKKPLKVPTLEDVVTQTIENVVHVRNNIDGRQGSGVLVAPDLVLTARHVAGGGQDFDVMTNDGKVYKTTRAISSKKYDVGFIKLDVQLLVSTKLGSIKNCRLGESVYAIGSPYGDTNFNSVTLGIISSVRRELEKFNFPPTYGWSVTFQTDANGEPGNSGCPVFTLDGVVRGILVGGFSNGIVYCVPVDVIMNDIDVIQRMFEEDDFKFEQPQDTRLVEIYEWFLQHREDSRIEELYQWFLTNKDDKRLDEIYEWFKEMTKVY